MRAAEGREGVHVFCIKSKKGRKKGIFKFISLFFVLWCLGGDLAAAFLSAYAINFIYIFQKNILGCCRASSAAVAAAAAFLLMARASFSLAVFLFLLLLLRHCLLKAILPHQTTKNGWLNGPSLATPPNKKKTTTAQSKTNLLWCSYHCLFCGASQSVLL